MAWNSIVDYMRATKQDASFANRSKLATQYGIKGYQGTANQNTQLLGLMQSKHTTTAPAKPVAAPAKPTVTPVKPSVPQYTPQQLALQAAQKDWFNNYSKQIVAGTNNTADLGRYNNYAKYLKLTKATLSSDALHNLSIKALSGDATAQAYLKAMGVQQQNAAQGLWNGFDTSTLQEGSALWNAYMKDNPNSEVAKAYDMKQYNTYGQRLMNGEAVSDNQLKYYLNAMNKWNLQDVRDPYYQQQQQLAKDKQGALDAQDTALNQGMGQMDANSFQQMQQLQQQMANNGMADSGIAADAYMRAQMANNQNYQQAYADSAKTKSDIQSQFDTAIGQSKIDQKAAADKKAADDATAQAEVAKQQSQQDQWLTQATGYVYINGKVQKDDKGNPITTLDYAKVLEQQRHNQATETNTATKNNNDYNLGMTKIQADIQKAADQMKYNYDKLDLQSTKVQADINNAAAKLDVAAQNADTAQARAQAAMLSTNLKSIQTQINAYNKIPKDKLTKKQKDALAALGKKLKTTQSQISKLANDLGK